MKNKTLIELNGRQYNAITGEMIGPARASAHAFKVIRSNSGHTANRTIDGFAGSSPTSLPKPQNNTHSTQHHSKTQHRTAAAHVTHHTPQRSQTLMRAAVKRPAAKRLDVARGSASPLSSYTAHVSKAKEESLRHPLHAARIERAKTIEKSHLISKFHAGHASVEKKTAHVPVRPAPSRTAPPMINSKTPPVHVAHAVKRSDPFMHAIEHANTHRHPAAKQPKLSHRIAQRTGVSSKRVNIIGSALAVMLLAGFVTYHKMPALTMRVAASKAGFQASMPEYKPAGFVLADRIQHSPGEVTVSYKSTSDQRAYKVTQRPSNWTSSTLVDQIQADRQPYQTYQDNGREIYIWGDNATWVDGGVWYQIAGESSLTTDQLLRIATSL